MTPQLRGFLLGVVLLLAATDGAHAQDAALALAIGHAARLTVDRSFQTVIIGDPDVVDVHADDDHAIVINALDSGVTNLVLVDASGVVTVNIRILVCAAWSNACDVRPAPGGPGLARPSSVRRDSRRAALPPRAAGEG
jgi:Flp pilus assembly secretin CpaC